jgi:hypothetical protein
MKWRQISYNFYDVRDAIEKYCFENFITLKEFLYGWWVSDQAYRYFEATGGVPVTSMKRLRQSYPKINLRRVRIAHGLRDE